MSKNLLTSMGIALGEGIILSALKNIQNTLSENLNSVLQSLLRLRGPKTIESVKRQICAVVLIRNTPHLLDPIQIDQNIRGKLYINNIKLVELSCMENGMISM